MIELAPPASRRTRLDEPPPSAVVPVPWPCATGGRRPVHRTAARSAPDPGYGVAVRRLAGWVLLGGTAWSVLIGGALLLIG